MRFSGRRAQRGAALIAALAIVVLALAYLLVSRVHNASGFVAIDRDRNGAVLNQAKQALIGYVAQRAATAGEDDPGRLPCPEAPASFGGPNEGIAASVCSLPAIGRLPWRTLGLDKLVDSRSEPLWYVVSPGWALPNSTAHTLINSNSLGQLTVNGIANDSVALIVAPGAITTSTCTGSMQVRAASGAPDKCNYLEDVNAAGATFVTTSATSGFNDQVVRITAAELLPEIEAAIATRIEREIVPQLKTVYATSTWGANVSAANPVYPFPAPFADPSAAASFNGSASSCDATNGVCQGLFPVRLNNAPGSTTTLCSTGTEGPLCDPTFVKWTSGTIQVQSFDVAGLINVTPGSILGTLFWTPPANNCTVNMGNSPHTLDCTLAAPGALGFLTTNIKYSIVGNVGNVAMALRQFNPSASLPGVTTTSAPTISMNADGSATITINGIVSSASGGGLSLAICGLSGFILGVTLQCNGTTVSIPMSLLPDHPLLNANDSTWGWFFRNEWYRVLYYVVARSQTAAALPTAPSCLAGTNCLVVNNLTPANDKRSIFVLAGRSLAGTVGANRSLNDFLDSAENRNGDRLFEKIPVNAVSNDRVVVVDTN